jgi:hypothetical protein
VNTFLKFFEAIGPSLIKLVISLFQLHKGNADTAIRDLEDRTAEINRQRAEVDAALAAKHRDDTPTDP